MSDITRILLQVEQGDPQATEKRLPLVYDELRKLKVKRARECMSRIFDSWMINRAEASEAENEP